MYIRDKSRRLLFAAIGAMTILLAITGCPRPDPPKAGVEPSPVDVSDEGGALNAVLPNYHALVIGINDYGNAGRRDWSNLRTARADAVGVADVLRKEYAFDVRTLLDGQATRGNIMAALSSIMSLGSNDAAIVYFAGHGYLDADMDEGHWIPSDARFKTNGRLVTEDWIWNSTVTKMVGASRLRHVLIIADACFSGSLFRGEGPTPAERRQLRWYESAIQVPSRFLLTSGDMEPVLDSGGRHSVFAQQLLNALHYPEEPIFSATELGLSIRTAVSARTRQLPRVGSLNVPSHAGGEFVFVRREGLEGEAIAAIDMSNDVVPEFLSQIRESVSQIETNRMAQSASLLLDTLSERYGEDSEATRLVASYLSTTRRLHKVAELYDLLQGLHGQSRGVVRSARTEAVQPRILACLGPTLKGDTQTIAPPIVIRIGIQNAIASLGGCVVVEREAVESALRELAVGTTEHADVQVEPGLGKLLPASLLLVGETVATEDSDEVYLRVIETASLRVLASTSRRIGSSGDIDGVVRDVSEWIVTQIRKNRPFECSIPMATGETAGIPIGTFHGLSSGTVFDVLLREQTDAAAVRAPEEVRLGVATVARMNERSSVLSIQWEGDRPTARCGRILMVREVHALE